MDKEQHKCNERCICPIHETPLIYAPKINDHACQDVDCKYGHGMKHILDQELMEQYMTRCID